jgi:hypothetical protein
LSEYAFLVSCPTSAAFNDSLMVTVVLSLSSFVLLVHASQVPTSKATFPAAWNSKLSETISGLHMAATKQDSILRYLQGGDEDVELEDICQELLLSLVRIGCTCKGRGTGEVTLKCPYSSCLWCDEDLERCGTVSYTLELGWNGTPPDYIVRQSVSFSYTTGETVLLARSTCDVLDGFLDSCSECVAYVNDEDCTSCAMCEDGFSLSVDCENLAPNSSFSECLSVPPNYGIFQGLGFDICQAVEPNNNACSNSTLLPLVYPWTDELDSISLHCTLADGNDVSYSVEGTGDTIVATTCSPNYVEATMDVFSGPDSCEELECIPAASFSCGGQFTGSIVSWSSKDGVSYHLRVVVTSTVVLRAMQTMQMGTSKLLFGAYHLLTIWNVQQVSCRPPLIHWDLL